MDLPPAPTGDPLLMSPALVVAAARNPDGTPQGACHRRLQLRWWPLLDLPPAPRGACHQRLQLNLDNNPQGSCHRRLQLQWWSLPDLPPASPRGPTIDVFNIGGGRCRICRQHPHGAHHRRLQLRWWPLSKIPTAPLGCLPSTSPASVVAAAEPATSTHRGPAIDVFSSGGGRCQKSRQHPQGPAIDVSSFGGGRCRTYRQHP
jgi:hypothetical protein